MFNLECTKCGNKGLIREVDVNTDNSGMATDCMTQIINDNRKFEFRKNTHGFFIKCNECGNLITEHDKPY